MENSRPIVKFYEKRTFGEKMSAAIDFIKNNLKLLLKLCVYLLLPMAFIQAIFMNAYLGEITNFTQMSALGTASSTWNSLAPMFVDVLLLVLLGILSNALLISITPDFDSFNISRASEFVKY